MSTSLSFFNLFMQPVWWAWLKLLICLVGDCPIVTNAKAGQLQYILTTLVPPLPFGRICFVVLVMKKGGESSWSGNWTTRRQTKSPTLQLTDRPTRRNWYMDVSAHGRTCLFGSCTLVVLTKAKSRVQIVKFLAQEKKPLYYRPVLDQRIT